MSITGCRNDALTTLLNGFGYQPILLPRTGLNPPDVYIYNDLKLTRKGPLGDYMVDGTAMPTPSESKISSIERRETSKKTGSAAASFLGDALKCIGITSAPKLDLSFTNGDDLVFSFDKITAESIDPSKIERLLNSKLLKGAFAKEDVDSGMLHVVYEYAFAGELTMKGASARSGGFNAKALQIQTYLDVGAQGQVSVQNETTISFSGNAGPSAAFAFKIARIEKRGKTWRVLPDEDPGEGFLADEGGTKPYLLERGVVLRVEGE